MSKKEVLTFVFLLCLAITCFVFAGTHDPWDGTKWDVASPDIDQPHGNAYKEMYDLRKGVALRANREHVTYATSSAGGWHLNGSAVCFEGTGAEPNLPDDSAALSDIERDRGRLKINDNYDPPVLERWDGSAWEVLGRYFVDAASLELYLHNLVEEDSEGGRESRIRAYGEQTGGEKTTLGYLEFSHDGTSDDEKGKFAILLNDGDDANSPSLTVLAIGSDQLVELPGALSIVGSFTINTDKFTVADANGNTVIDGTLDVNGVIDPTLFDTTNGGFLDEDDFASDANDKVASQQSIKAYIAAQIASEVTLSEYTDEDSNTDAMLKAHAYLAATDGQVSAYVSSSAIGQSMVGYVGATDDPAGAGEAIQYQSNSGTGYFSFSFEVAEGEYFEITTTSGNAPTIRWKSHGTLSKPVDQEP